MVTAAQASITSVGTLTSLDVSGDLAVGGTLTYEDVTNIDSVGVITARSGGYLDIRTGSSINTNATGSAASGTIHKNTNSGEFAVVSGGTGGNNHLTFYTSASAAPTEKLRIGPVGQIGIAGANYGTSGQFLQSQGSGSAVQWASVSQPDLMADTWRLVTQYINAQGTLGSGGSDWERDDTYGNGLLGTGAASAGMSVSNGYFSFPTTGFYSVKFYGHHSMSYSDGRSIIGYLVYTANNFSSSEYAAYYTVNCIGNTGQIIHGSSSCEKIFDITNVSNQKFKLAVGYAQNATSGRTTVDTNANRTYVIVTRLGDT